jgi:hypothetical protein
LVIEQNGIQSRYSPNLSEEEIEQLQHVAALQRERRMDVAGFGDLCQSDLD